MSGILGERPGPFASAHSGVPVRRPPRKRLASGPPVHLDDGHPRPRPAGLRFTLLHEEPLRVVLSPRHPLAGRGGPVALSDLRDDVWVASDRGTGHHDMVVGNCRAFGGYEPDLRHRSNDADVQLELVRTTGAVALLPALTLPTTADPALAIRDVAGQELGRRLLIVLRDAPAAPALAAFLTVVTGQARSLDTR